MTRDPMLIAISELERQLAKCRQEKLRWKERAGDYLAEWERCQAGETKEKHAEE